MDCGISLPWGGIALLDGLGDWVRFDREANESRLTRIA